jgi:hypothetical protein
MTLLEREDAIALPSARRVVMKRPRRLRELNS